MAVNMQSNNGGIVGWIDTHPAYAIGGLVLGALLVVGVVNSKKNGTATTSAPANTAPVGDLSGLQRDANGNPIVYRDTQDLFYNTSIIENSNNQSTVSTVTTTNSTTVNPPSQIVTTPPPPVNTPPPPVNTPPSATADFYYDPHWNSWYDKGNPKLGVSSGFVLGPDGHYFSHPNDPNFRIYSTQYIKDHNLPNSADHLYNVDASGNITAAAPI